jgi:hypothetical protein
MNELKPWFFSKTIWGSLVSASAALATVFGLSIDGQTQVELTEIAVQIAGAAGALLAVYGRLSAKHGLR